MPSQKGRRSRCTFSGPAGGPDAKKESVGGPAECRVKKAGEAGVPSVGRPVGPTLKRRAWGTGRMPGQKRRRRRCTFSGPAGGPDAKKESVGGPAECRVKKAGEAGVPSVGRPVGPTLKRRAWGDRPNAESKRPAKPVYLQWAGRWARR